MATTGPKKKILIITADVGFGHRSAANAIVEALREKRCNECTIEVVNPLDDERAPAVLHDSQEDYDRLIRDNPEVYRLRYKLSDSMVPNAIFESAVTVMLYNIIRDTVERFGPDAIVTTHPLFPAPVSSVLAIKNANIPLIVAVTDLVNVHISWFHKLADMWLVPTEAVYQQALKNELPKESVHITGIPVRPAILCETRPPAEIRKENGWDPEKPTILVVGSKRVRNLIGVLNYLNHSGFPFQLVIAAGGDNDLFRQLQAVEWHPSVFLYNYVEDMPSFLKAADCIITKAGGLIVTESLACGLPMLLIDASPGQEQGNAEYVVKMGAGEQAKDPFHSLETMAHWLDNGGKLLAEYKLRAKALGRPYSAYAAADLIWTAAERGNQVVLKSRANVLPKLLELLSNSGITP